MRKSNTTRGGNRAGAGAKKDLARAAIGRNVNLTIQGMPYDVAQQIVQDLMRGNRKNALGLIRNMVLVERRDEAERLAEECARLLSPYPEIWTEARRVEMRDERAPLQDPTEKQAAVSRAAALLREIAGLVNGQCAATVVNHAFAEQPLKPRGAIIEKDALRLAAVNRIKQTAQEERAYWTLVFELNAKLRADELTPDDLERLQAIAPSDLAPD